MTKKLDAEYITLTPSQLADINTTRTRAGIAPITIRERKCSNCGKGFKSEGSHNRQCRPCKTRLQVPGSIDEFEV